MSAYGMRIRVWSSDVCSSDLECAGLIESPLRDHARAFLAQVGRNAVEDSRDCPLAISQVEMYGHASGRARQAALHHHSSQANSPTGLDPFGLYVIGCIE